MDIELSTTQAVKDSYLTIAGYQTDSDTPNVHTGTGFIKRRAPFVTHHTCEYISKLFVDLFNSEHYLVNNVNIDIELSPNETVFNLIAKDNNVYRFQLISCKLYVKSLYLMDGLNLELAAKLELEPARYSLQRTEMSSLQIAQGLQQFSANLFHDQVPRSIIIAFVRYNSFIGLVTSSPFTFEPFDIKDINIQVSGHRYPNIPYSNLDFPNNIFARPFHDMQDNLGFLNSTESNGIKMEEYKNYKCFFTFNLTISQENDGCHDLIRTGTTSVVVTFSTAVPAGGIQMIVYGSHDSLLLCDSNRVISSDMTV
uniref:Uncharacterized protein n=1 Tax=Panagrolaimus sp. PS1159 TaxID=55785 RepID=A0AC35FK25_9BILA